MMRCTLVLSLTCTLVLMIYIPPRWGAWNVANTPPMGFNTWNLYGCSVDADILMGTATAMVSTGLAKVGYEYVLTLTTAGCWPLEFCQCNSVHSLPWAEVRAIHSERTHDMRWVRRVL